MPVTQTAKMEDEVTSECPVALFPPGESGANIAFSHVTEKLNKVSVCHNKASQKHKSVTFDEPAANESL